MAQLKSTSVTGNLSVTGNTVASKFIKNSGTSDQLLLANGNTHKLSDITTDINEAYDEAKNAQTEIANVRSKVQTNQQEIDDLEKTVTTLTQTVNNIGSQLTAEANARTEADNTKLSLNGNEMMTGPLSFASNALPEAEDATYTKIIIANSSNDKTTLGYRKTTNFIQDLAIAQIYNFKGNLDDLDDLQAIASASVGDVYFISDTYHSWACKAEVTSATESNYKTYWSDLGVIANLSNYVTLDDPQEISGKKTFTSSDGLIITTSDYLTNLASASTMTIKDKSIDCNDNLSIKTTANHYININSGKELYLNTAVNESVQIKEGLVVQKNVAAEQFQGKVNDSGYITMTSNAVEIKGATTLNGSLIIKTGNSTTLSEALTVADDKSTTLYGPLTVTAGNSTTLNGPLSVKIGSSTALSEALTVATDKSTTLYGSLFVSKETKLNNTVSITTTNEESSIHIDHNSIIARNNNGDKEEVNLQLGNDSTKVCIGTSTFGNVNQPIYLFGGVLTRCNTYAGGTQITLNGTNKGALNASFYAPTEVGNSGEILQSSGTGEPEWLSTLPVANGGTGLNTLTSGQALIGNGTSEVSFRAITNNTSATAVSASTNLITANTLYYHTGNTNITTVGTLTTGTWNATTIGVAYGGTGRATLTSGQALIGNGTGVVSLRSITDLSSAATVTANTNLITANTLHYYTGTANTATVGTLTTGTWNATTIGVAYGGTGLTSWTANRLIYASAATTLATSNHYISNTKVAINTTAEPANAFYVHGSGIFKDTVTATAYYATSDVRLKKNFKKLITKQSILDLPIYIFDFIDGNKNQVGCIAQDLQKICPEIVTTDEKGYLSIQENKIVYLLIDEVKKLQTEINELKKGK